MPKHKPKSIAQKQQPVKHKRPYNKKNSLDNPLKLIEAIRNSTPYTSYIYLNGSCYRFYLILKAVYATATPYYRYDHEGGHVITKIGTKFYDIMGEVSNTHQFLPFDEKHFPNYTHYAKNWWCKLSTLVLNAEKAVLTSKEKKLWKF